MQVLVVVTVWVVVEVEKRNVSVVQTCTPSITWQA
jgi:hypothetical protein